MAIIKRTNSDDPDFQALVLLLDRELTIIDGDDHDFYHQFNKITMIRHAVVAYIDDIPVSCGAFKEYESGTVEIKRMYTLPEHRGKKIAAEVLTELEYWAAELHYTACILETGRKQTAAISLYERSGYTLIPNYGQYANVENSICMRKEL